MLHLLSLKQLLLSLQHMQYYGDPFFFLIHDGEALSDIKVRIQKKFQVPDEQFLKVWSQPFISYIWSTSSPFTVVNIPLFCQCYII
jgi:ubiquitin carboxyl-terminal hydrolase 7